MKKTKIVVPALAVLLLSTAASVSGTVAWFSMNTSVKVDGMQVSTRVASNLLIAEKNLEQNYTDSITQSRVGILEPASTIDGKAFWYTTNAKGDGSAIVPQGGGNTYKQYSEAKVENTDNPATEAIENNWTNHRVHTAAGKEQYDANFNIAYGFSVADDENVCYAYIDYAFYIKATSVTDNSVLYMSNCNLLYNTGTKQSPTWAPISANSGDLAWRVGLLSTAAPGANQEANDANLTAKSIIGLNLTDKFALNQNQVNLVENVVPGETDVTGKYTNPYGTGATASDTAVAGTKYYTTPGQTPNAVSSATALAAVSTQGAKAQAATGINAGVTSYTRIVVRLWLEGEDVSCTSTTYAQLTNNWKLDLEFKLGTSTDGVENISTVVA